VPGNLLTLHYSLAPLYFNMVLHTSIMPFHELSIKSPKDRVLRASGHETTCNYWKVMNPERA
jgi:hypothetical protein